MINHVYTGLSENLAGKPLKFTGLSILRFSNFHLIHYITIINMIVILHIYYNL